MLIILQRFLYTKIKGYFEMEKTKKVNKKYTGYIEKAHLKFSKWSGSKYFLGCSFFLKWSCRNWNTTEEDKKYALILQLACEWYQSTVIGGKWVNYYINNNNNLITLCIYVKYYF